MTPTLPESKALRQWARATGYTVGDRGVLPESLRDQWVAAGAPWPDGTKAPDGWTPEAKRRNSPRSNGHERRTSEFPEGPPPSTFAFDQPSAPSRVDLGLDPLVVDLVAGGHAEVMTQEEADWFVATRDLYCAQNQFESAADLQDLDRLLTMELLMHRHTKWLASGKDYAGNTVSSSGELAKGLKDRNASISQLKDQMGLSKKARDANASSVAERWDDLLRRAKRFNYHRVEQVRTALLLMNQMSAVIGTFYRSDEEERRRTGYRSEAEIVEWIRDEILPKFHDVDEHFRNNEQSTWARG